MQVQILKSVLRHESSNNVRGVFTYFISDCYLIFTTGANPYPGMGRDQLISQLHDGYRMPKPQYCSDEL